MDIFSQFNKLSYNNTGCEGNNNEWWVIGIGIVLILVGIIMMFVGINIIYGGKTQNEWHELNNHDVN